MSNFLVTGGCGFIGSHLADALVKRGDSVTVLDNLSTGSIFNLPRGVGISILDRVGEIDRLKDPYDGIFHFGMPSSSPMYRESPALVGRVVSEAVCLFEFARKMDCKVVIASTSSLYNLNEPPHHEGMPVYVTDYYSEARYFVERLAELYFLLHGIRTCCLRLFSVYGPREESKGRYANLVSQFLWAMRGGESPVIYGDGRQTRDFVHVSDAVRAFLLAMDRKPASPAPTLEDIGVFNVGTGVETSLNALVDMINRELGTSIPPKYVKNPVKNYVARTCADTRKARTVLGFEAKTALVDGIRYLRRDLLGYFRQTLKG